MAEASASLIGASTVALTNGLSGKGSAQDVQLGGQVALNADRFNRQLHKVEATQLDALKKGKSAAEQARLDAAACALVHCADGVPKDDPQYAKLAAMQAEGQAYKSEQKALLATGEFIYQPVLDKSRDALTRHGETLTRVGGAVNLATGTVGMVGGGLIATGGALGCVPSAGVSCAAVPLGGYIAYESSQQAQQGNSALLGPYQSTEGQRVLDSLSLKTYPGERDPLKDIGVDAAKLGLTVAAGKFIPKALASAEGLEMPNATASSRSVGLATEGAPKFSANALQNQMKEVAIHRDVSVRPTHVDIPSTIRDQAVVGAQRCGNSSPIWPALCVGNRRSTSRR